jgi:hypothetical protein
MNIEPYAFQPIRPAALAATQGGKARVTTALAVGAETAHHQDVFGAIPRVSSVQASSQEPTRIGGIPVSYEDINAVAKRVGYVGVSPGDVQRAYAYGHSLLIDYRA